VVAGDSTEVGGVRAGVSVKVSSGEGYCTTIIHSSDKSLVEEALGVGKGRCEEIWDGGGYTSG